MNSFPAIGSSVIEFTTIDSTNAFAMQLANAGNVEHGTVVITDYQTHGKGQQGNSWQAESQKNILLSVVLKTTREHLQDQFLLNAAFCSSIAHLLMEEYELAATAIKWPNDIYVNKKKIAGILIENIIRGASWQYAIVGVGININQASFAEGLNATSLINETGKATSLLAFRKLLFAALNDAYKLFTSDRTRVLSEYNNLLHGINTEIRYFKNGKDQLGTLHGASEQGFLKIDDLRYRHGEIAIFL